MKLDGATLRSVRLAAIGAVLAGIASSVHHIYGALLYDTPWRLVVSLWIPAFVLLIVSALFIYWTVAFSQLPEQQLSVSVGEKFIPSTLTDQDGQKFHSPDLVGKSGALYLFYRGAW